MPEVAPPPRGNTETCKPGQMERVDVNNKFEALVQISAQLHVDANRVITRAQLMNLSIEPGDTLVSYGSEVITVVNKSGQEKGAILTKKPDHASMTDLGHVQQVLERSKAHVNACKATIGETWKGGTEPVKIETTRLANGETIYWHAPVDAKERMSASELNGPTVLPGESL